MMTKNQNVNAKAAAAAIYYDPEHPAAFGGVLRFAKAAKLNKKDATAWLAGQRVYTLHKPARKCYNT